MEEVEIMLVLPGQFAANCSVQVCSAQQTEPDNWPVVGCSLIVAALALCAAAVVAALARTVSRAQLLLLLQSVTNIVAPTTTSLPVMLLAVLLLFPFDNGNSQCCVSQIPCRNLTDTSKHKEITAMSVLQTKMFFQPTLMLAE